MRTKSVAVNPRPRLWNRFRNPSLFGGSYLNEASEKDSSESDVLDKSYDFDGDTSDSDVEIVPDSFEERVVPPKKRQCFGTHGPDPSLNSSNVDACILCGRADDQVLACSEAGCPVSLHEKCMNGGLDCEDVGSFYCPYCWYKKQLLRSKTLRDKAVAAEKALLNFLDSEMIGGNNGKEILGEVELEETNLSIGRIRNLDQQKDSMDTDEIMDHPVQSEADQQIDGHISEEDVHDNVKAIEDQQQGAMEKDKDTNQFEVLENEERVEAENWEDAEEGKDEEIAKDQQEGAMGEDKSADGSPFQSIQETFGGKESEEDQLNVKRKEKPKPNEQASNISSSESTNGCAGQDPDDQSVSVPPNQRHGEQKLKNEASSQNVCSSTRSSSRSWKETSTSRKRLKDVVVKNDKRKKLFWTPEEENVLREGMAKLSTEANKKIPWRKILEYGRAVFHETRNPTDLKDKWRNMTGRKF